MSGDLQAQALGTVSGLLKYSGPPGTESERYFDLSAVTQEDPATGLSRHLGTLIIQNGGAALMPPPEIA